MEERKGIKPFAITARKIGIAQCIYTKLIVVNAVGDTVLGTYVNAIWDTGSPKCLIYQSLADFLHIKPVSHSYVSGVGGCEVVGDQTAYINIVSNGDIIPVECSIIKDVPNSVGSFLLGMNFISRGSLSLTYDGRETVFSFISPPVNPIDFIKQANEDHTIEYQQLSYGKESLELITNRELAHIIHGISK